jgi:hypothetical protein
MVPSGLKRSANLAKIREEEPRGFPDLQLTKPAESAES